MVTMTSELGQAARSVSALPLGMTKQCRLATQSERSGGPLSTLNGHSAAMFAPARGLYMLFLMDDRPTTIERAYQLAKSGECGGIADIKDRLRAEGYIDAPVQIYGPTLTADA